MTASRPMGGGSATPWPDGVMGRVGLAFPQATGAQLAIAKAGFEGYLSAVALWGPGASVAMPSKGADEVWHSAMLHSRFYAALCAERVGWFVHHDPGPLPGSPIPWGPSERDAELTGLAKAWVGSCLFEGLDWRGQDEMPSLFAADRLMGLSDGFAFSADPLSSAAPLSAIIERARAVGPPPEAAPARSARGLLGALRRR